MSRIAPPVFLVAVLALAAAQAWWAPPPARSDDAFRIDPAQGARLGEWMNPSDEPSPYRLLGGEIRQSFGVFRYEGPEGVVEVELHHHEALAEPAVRTQKFSLRSTPPAPALVDVLARRLTEREGTYRWIEGEAAAPTVLSRLTGLQLPVAWFLLAQAPVWLVLVGRRVWTTLASLPSGARRALVGAIAAGAVARLLLAPLRLVMLYVGYQLTSQAVSLESIPRYGAAVPAFHHLVLSALGADHLFLLRTHAVLGVALIPLVATSTQALFGRPRATVLAAFFWALMPAFVAHDTSEALTVPALVWLLGGLVLLTEALERTSPLALTGSVALLALAATSRPELPLVVALAALTVLARQPSSARRWAMRTGVPLFIAFGLLVLPHVSHVLSNAALLQAEDSLPLGNYSVSFIRIALFDPRLYPVALIPLVVVAVLPRRGGPRVSVVLWVLAVAVADIAATFLDLDPANILRVQVPGALFFSVAAAVGGDGMLEWLTPRGRSASTVAVGLLALSALPCVESAFRRTNEDEEEAFLRVARVALPQGAAVLVRLGYGDLEGSRLGGPTHLYFPDYLFRVPNERRVEDIIEWERAPTRDAYFYLGVRCYTPERAVERPSEDGAPTAATLRSACRRLLSRPGAEVIFEQEVPSRGDPLGTGYYPARGVPMRLALVRLPAG